MIEFRTLGTLELSDPANGQDFCIVLGRPKLVALLAYLTLARPNGLHHRDTLLGIFWPELSQPRARHALSQTLYMLRRSLGEGVVITRGDEEVGLDRERFWSDVEAFEIALEAGDRIEALELYGGELLNGFYVSGCAKFERWLEGERDRLRGLAVTAALELADERAASDNGVGALYWLRQALRWESDNETIIQHLMEHLRRLGDRPGAIREFQSFKRRLAEELELEPSAETIALAEAIQVEQARVEEMGPTPSAEIDDAHRPADTGSGSPHVQVERARGFSWRWAAVAVVGVIAVGGLLRFFGPTSAPAERDPRRVVVAAFANRTDDPALEPIGRLVGERIAGELSRTGLVRVVFAGLGPSVAPTDGEEVDDVASWARKLTEETGAGTLVMGSYSQRADSIVFEARLLDLVSGEMLSGLDEVRGPIEDPVETVEDLRRRVVGSLATHLDRRLASWAEAASQPPSFKAYQMYASGLDLYFNRDYDKAARVFHEATAADPTFTSPLVWAVLAHHKAAWMTVWTHAGANLELEIPAAADVAMNRLDTMRERLAPWDVAMLDYLDARSQGDVAGAYRAMRRVVEITPESEWLYELAMTALLLRRPGEAADLLARLESDQGWLRDWPWPGSDYWSTRTWARHWHGDYAEELEDAQYIDHPRSRLRVEIRALAGLGRVDEAVARFDQAIAVSSPELTLRVLIGELLVHGHEEAAQRAIEQTGTWLAAGPDGEMNGVHAWSRGSLLYTAGRWEDCQALFDWLAEQDPVDRDVSGHLGVIAARLGERPKAMRYAKSLEAYPDLGRSGSGLLWRARIAASLDDRDRAIVLLRKAVSGIARSPFAFIGRNYGHPANPWTHIDPAFELLWDDAAYQELMAPQG
jgi:DNA-binding SARP family transcriptional activator/TolB-like protein